MLVPSIDALLTLASAVPNFTTEPSFKCVPVRVTSACGAPAFPMFGVTEVMLARGR